MQRHAELMELADMQDLGSCGQPCGFESHIPHNVILFSKPYTTTEFFWGLTIQYFLTPQVRYLNSFIP